MLILSSELLKKIQNAIYKNKKINRDQDVNKT